MFKIRKKLIWNLDSDEDGFMTKGKAYTVLRECGDKLHIEFTNNHGKRDCALKAFFITLEQSKIESK